MLTKKSHADKSPPCKIPTQKISTPTNALKSIVFRRYTTMNNNNRHSAGVIVQWPNRVPYMDIYWDGPTKSGLYSILT